MQHPEAAYRGSTLISRSIWRGGRTASRQFADNGATAGDYPEARGCTARASPAPLAAGAVLSVGGRRRILSGHSRIEYRFIL